MSFPIFPFRRVEADLENTDSVNLAADTLADMGVDYLIHNAGAYAIPRRTCESGFNNVFQIDFVSPYCLTKKLLPSMRTRAGAKVIAVGSIAHNYSKTDPKDVDFSSHKSSAKVYGNAKRYLMFSMYELFRNEKDVALSVVHPGITFTNITAHYPKIIFALIKYPMKIIFMSRRKACLSLLQGVFEDCGYHEWIGPRIFNIWGLPEKRKLKTCDSAESRYIGETAEKIYESVKCVTDGAQKPEYL